MGSGSPGVGHGGLRRRRTPLCHPSGLPGLQQDEKKLDEKKGKRTTHFYRYFQLNSA
jgi:hypothetical protein